MGSATFDSATLTSLLSEACERWNVPGAALGLFSDGSFVSTQFGVLDADKGQPVSDDSLFQIGSITKVLTATLIMKLVEQGEVELDAPLRDYIPDFRVADLDASRSVTVRQLLNHTNGLAGDFMVDTGAPPNELERYLQRAALLPLCHKVGEALSYSNSAYCFAGLLVERVTGKSFFAAMQELLFDPAGLSNSVVDPELIPWERASSGHSADPEDASKMKPLDSIHIIPASTAPAGATTMMTIEDLIAFARLHLDGGKSLSGKQVLNPDTVAQMQEPSVTIPVPQRDISRWGLGWFLVDQGTQTLIGHDGGTVGQYSFLRIHKESGTIIGLLTNGGDANNCMIDIFDDVLGELIGCTHSAAPDPVDDPQLDLTRFVGRFETVASKTDFWIEGDELHRKSEMMLGDTVIPEAEAALIYCGDDQFLKPAGEGRPSLICFSDLDEAGVPRVLFSGLRVARRVIPL